jgi:chromosome segregation ATPase
MIADIRFACTQCGQFMRADPAAAGLTADCPHCGRPLVIPGEQDPALRSEADSAVADDATELEKTRQQLAVSMAECERLTAAVTHAQAEIKSFQADRRTMKSELAQTRHRLGVAETELAQYVESLTEAQTHARQLGAECESLQNDLALVQARAAATDTQLTSREAELRDLTDRLKAAHTTFAVAQAEINALQDESAILRRDLDVAHSALESEHRLQKRIEETEAELLKAGQQLEASEAKCAGLQLRCETLTGETTQLRNDLKETEAGREMVRLRATVGDLEAERHQLRLANASLAEDFAQSEKNRTALDDLVRSLGKRLEGAEKRAEASSHERLKQDNMALRGIITRQNGELERRHVELHRLKRMRVAVRLVYALIILGGILLALAIVQILPNIDW